MTTNLDIANRALQFIGTRTNMTLAEFNGQTSNEAIQTQLIMFKLRDELNRMAPWNFAHKYTTLTYITSISGTPENTLGNPSLWQPGMPPPPWAYEYQYPVDCLRAIKIVPQYISSAGSIPIYPPGVGSGTPAIGWTGPALKFHVAQDAFFAVNAATVAAGGTGHAVNDIITLVQPSFTFTQNTAPVGQPPANTTFTMGVGAPAQLLVTGVAGGVITSVTPVAIVSDASAPYSGSYFSVPANPVAQGSSTGAGINATFNLTFNPQAQQRIILTNQENSILCYNAQVTDPNVMDPTFQDAWIAVLGARLTFQLTGNIQLANQLIGETNQLIMEARRADGNEDITVNDVTPDFLRIRGNYGGPNYEFSPNSAFDWGAFYSPY